MTQYTKWYHIEPMFTVISLMMMILFCWFSAYIAIEQCWSRQFASLNSDIDCTFSSTALWIFLAVSFVSSFIGNSAFFCLVLFQSGAPRGGPTSKSRFISTGYYFTFWSAAKSLVLSIMTNLTRTGEVSTIEVKFRQGFDLIAFVTKFCYCGFRHGFFLNKKSCLEPTVGYVPTLGSLYYKRSTILISTIIFFFSSISFSQFAGIKPELGRQLDRSHQLGNPVVYWPMLENSGGLTYDLSGNGNTGTIVNAVWVPGKFGPALHFDGTGDYVQTTLPSIFSPANPISVVIFARDLGTGLRGLVNVQGASGAAGQILCVYFDTANNRMIVSHVFDISYSRYSGTIATTNWNHFVITHAGGNVQPNIYVNGVLNQIATGASLTNFGENVIQTGKGFSAAYDGLSEVDHVYFYNRALSAAEIWQLYTDMRCMFVQERPELYVTAAAEEEESQIIEVSRIATQYSPFAILFGIAYICTRRERYGKGHQRS